MGQKRRGFTVLDNFKNHEEKKGEPSSNMLVDEGYRTWPRRRRSTTRMSEWLIDRNEVNLRKKKEKAGKKTRRVN